VARIGATVDVTIGWCSEFVPRWKAGRLLRASRPPALFQYHLGRFLQPTGISLTGRAILDEDLGVDVLSPETEAAIAGSFIVFLSSHGRMDGTTYRLRLRRGEWTPTQAAPQDGPSVLVLDTCNVVESGTNPENTAWKMAGQCSPAIVLGFIGAATDGYSASMRGRAFAEHLAVGRTYADAWFRAIEDTQPKRHRDVAIAIAFGPDQTQAQSTLDTASLATPPARTVADACRWKRSP
jgi:Family of unknown function (DUF6345)